ncbi:MAG: hypothetical protein H6836_09565 [Planctomycetes bacterium]|nr:hypothetical protein [Planctomycetota bacterium]MCB9889811.1 hypothetical protein [Planctomycetota bacterium]
MKISHKLGALLGASLLLAPLAVSQKPTTLRRVPARVSHPTNRTALLILLENGGVAANFAQCKVGGKPITLPKIPVAKCGKLALGLNPGENIAQLVKRAAAVIARNHACVNPASWKVEMIPFEEWFKATSDYLLEELAKAIGQLQNTRGKYGQVIVLEDKALNPQNALARLAALARAGYTVDIHVLTHGGENVFIGGDNARFTPTSFFTPAQKIPGLKLRSVYQMNCVSGSLIDEWTALGAKVVNGTYGLKNNYMPHSYFHFTGKWLAGATFTEAVLGAYQEARVYTEPVYNLIGRAGNVADSRHRVSGDGSCRLFTPTNPVAAVVAQTTATLCAGYKAARKTAAQACELLVRAGRKVEEIAQELAKQYGCPAHTVAKLLHDAKCTTDQIARGLAVGLRCSAEQAAKAMVAAGCALGSVGKALQRHFKASVTTVAKCLRAAGCSANRIASTLQKSFRCTTEQIARYLKTAGCSFDQVAKAVWSCVAKNAKGLQEVVDAMVKSFQMNIAQVGAEIARLGIKV